MAKKKNKPTIHLSKAKVFAEQNGICHYCEREMNMTINHSDLLATWDHVVPRINNGTNDRDNLVLACTRCNRAKGNLDYDTFVTARAWELPQHSLALLKIQNSAKRRGELNIIYHMARYCPSCSVVMTIPSRQSGE